MAVLDSPPSSPVQEAQAMREVCEIAKEVRDIEIKIVSEEEGTTEETHKAYMEICGRFKASLSRLEALEAR
jgi:hypothetical protein